MPNIALSALGLTKATTNTQGTIELATTAETLAGTRTDLACTPAGVAALVVSGSPAASTTVAGIAELSTNAEAAAKTDTTRTMTPSNVPSIMAAPGDIGGTTPAAGAFTTLSASGAFSLTGDQVTVAEGGTGLATITDHGVMLGSGTGAVTPTAVGATNQVFIGQSAADPIWSDDVDIVGTFDCTGAATFDSTVTIVDDLAVDTSTLFVDASANNVGIGTATPAAADKLHATFSTAGTTAIYEFEHTNNSNTASHVEVLVQNGGASGGDPFIALDVAGTQQYYIGIDNSDSDILKIGSGTAVGTTSSVQLTNAGALSVLRGNADVTRSDSGAVVSASVVNSSNTASSDAKVLVTCGGTSAGDAATVYSVSGGQAYAIGLDNSASDAFVIAASATLGSTNAISISTAGAVTIPVSLTNTGGDTITVRSDAGAEVTTEVTNSDNTNAASDAYFEAAVGGTSAGDAGIRFQISGGQNWSAGLDNSASDGFALSASNDIGTTNVMASTVAGEVTFPLSPAFFSYLASAAANKTGNGTSYTIGTDALTEVYDRNADATTAGVFTAPVTGIYDLRAQVACTGCTIATTFTLSIVTTGQTFTKSFVRAAEAGDMTMDLSVLATMTATDTASVTIVVSGEAGDTVDINGGAAGLTFFCGRLVA